MPSTTFGLQYKPGDFFYNIGGDNKELLYSFPFGNTIDSQKKLIDWANGAKNPANPPITVMNDIFDPEISTVILDPTNDFINTFLPGNMVFNDNFNEITVNLIGTAGDLANATKRPIIAPISGQLALKQLNQDAPDIVLDINNASTNQISMSVDEFGNLQPNVEVDAGVSPQVAFTDTDGATSNIIITTTGHNCKVRKLCTLNHWHYSGTCQSNIQTDINGNTSCKCSCTGVPVFNDSPHSHCDSYIMTPGSRVVTTPNGTVTPPPGLDFLSMMQGIKLSLTSQFPTVPPLTPGPDGTTSFPYDYLNPSLNAHDLNIRKAILDYYYEVNTNKQLQTSIYQRGSKDATSKTALFDANVQYKTEYLNVFNIIVGIFGAGGYIYLMSQS